MQAKTHYDSHLAAFYSWMLGDFDAGKARMRAYFDQHHIKPHSTGLAVDPRYRGLGIGRTLAQLCIQHAQVTGETGVALHTGEFMNAARQMYEALGFKREKELTPIYGKRYWLYKLSF